MTCIFVFCKKHRKKFKQLLGSANKSTIDAIKTASKRAIQKTAEGTGDLIDHKIPDIIKNISKKSPTKLH